VPSEVIGVVPVMATDSPSDVLTVVVAAEATEDVLREYVERSSAA
jgi:hypothetical protein